MLNLAAKLAKLSELTKQFVYFFCFFCKHRAKCSLLPAVNELVEWLRKMAETLFWRGFFGRMKKKVYLCRL